MFWFLTSVSLLTTYLALFFTQKQGFFGHTKVVVELPHDCVFDDATWHKTYGCASSFANCKVLNQVKLDTNELEILCPKILLDQLSTKLDHIFSQLTTFTRLRNFTKLDLACCDVEPCDRHSLVVGYNEDSYVVVEKYKNLSFVIAIISKRHCLMPPRQPLGIPSYQQPRLNAQQNDHWKAYIVPPKDLSVVQLSPWEVGLWTHNDHSWNLNTRSIANFWQQSLWSHLTVLSFPPSKKVDQLINVVDGESPVVLDDTTAIRSLKTKLSSLQTALEDIENLKQTDVIDIFQTQLLQLFDRVEVPSFGHRTQALAQGFIDSVTRLIDRRQSSYSSTSMSIERSESATSDDFALRNLQNSVQILESRQKELVESINGPNILTVMITYLSNLTTLPTELQPIVEQFGHYASQFILNVIDVEAISRRLQALFEHKLDEIVSETHNSINQLDSKTKIITHSFAGEVQLSALMDHVAVMFREDIVEMLENFLNVNKVDLFTIKTGTKISDIIVDGYPTDLRASVTSDQPFLLFVTLSPSWTSCLKQFKFYYFITENGEITYSTQPLWCHKETDFVEQCLLALERTSIKGL